MPRPRRCGPTAAGSAPPRRTEGSSTRADLSGRVGLLLGQEGGGLEPRLLERFEAIRIPTGRVESLNVAMAAGVLLYALLMFRWFFAHAWMRPRLLATLATHTPVVPLTLLHIAVLFATSGAASRPLRPAAVALLVGQYWAAVLAWEIARKIRAPEEEDDYVTYSRRLGRRGALALAGAAQAASVAAGLALTSSAGLRPAAVVLLLGGFALCGRVQARRHRAR